MYVLVAGANLVIKHQGRTGRVRTQTGRIEMEAPIHISNVQLIGSDGKPTRAGYEVAANGDLPGLNAVAYGLINQELEAGDSGLRSFVSVQTSLVMFPILQWGSEEQKKEWLPKLAAGDKIGCFGLTEPGSGSDVAGARTTATRDGDDWIINGQKVWTSRAEHSDLMLLLARTTPADQVEKRTHGISTFLARQQQRQRHIRRASDPVHAGPDRRPGSRDHRAVLGRRGHEQPAIGSDNLRNRYRRWA